MAAVMDHGELEAIEMSELVNGEEHPQVLRLHDSVQPFGYWFEKYAVVTIGPELYVLSIFDNVPAVRAEVQSPAL